MPLDKPAVQVLVLFYSRHGSVQAVAEQIAMGVQTAGGDALLRTVPELILPDTHHGADAVSQAQAGLGTAQVRHENHPASLYPFVTMDELTQCHALAMGSPVRFGMMAAPLKAFWDTTSALWLKGSLIDKPAAVFTSSSSMHGGNEATLLGMMLPLLHHGMVMIGVPYDTPALHQTQSGGTPYGASHVEAARRAGQSTLQPLSMHEIAIARRLGERLTRMSQQLYR
jgi:NAD(P)H dehydrogenase (quinone)